MIWHIVRKDLNLLWPLVAFAAALQLGVAASSLYIGHFTNDHPYAVGAAGFATFIAQLLTVILIASTVHQDAIPGVRQDWLVRPIRRRDLLLAKIGFVVLFIHGPLFVADLVQGLGTGYSFGQTLAASMSREIYVLLFLTLPVLTFAALTRNLTEFFVGGLAAFVGVVAIVAAIVGGTVAALHYLGGVDTSNLQLGGNTGLQWIAERALNLAIIGSVLGLQYFRRKTLFARCLLVALAVLAFLLQLTPQYPTLAVQEFFVPPSAAAQAISLTFVPTADKIPIAQRRKGLDIPAVPQVNDADAAHLQALRTGIPEGRTPVYVPLRISGVAAGAQIVTDYATIKLIEADGAIDVFGPASRMELRMPASGDDAPFYQEMWIPTDVFERLKDQPVRMEISYILDLSEARGSYSLAASGDAQRIPELGWCATELPPAETFVRFDCIQIGRQRMTVNAALEHAQTGVRNPEVKIYASEPPLYGSGIPGVLTRYGASLPFRNRDGVGRYPVDGTLVTDARVVVSTLMPLDRFRKTAVIPEIRLGAWKAEIEPVSNEPRSLAP